MQYIYYVGKVPTFPTLAYRQTEVNTQLFAV